MPETKPLPPSPHPSTPPRKNPNPAALALAASSPSPPHPAAPPPPKKAGDDHHHHDFDKDYLSTLIYSVDPVSKAIEYFLESGKMGLTFVGGKPVAKNETWSSAIANWMKALDLHSYEVGALLRMDRWILPDSSRMACHAIFEVAVPAEAKTIYKKRIDGQWLNLSEIQALKKNRFTSVQVLEAINVFEQHNKAQDLGLEISTGDIYLGLDPQKTGGRRSGAEHTVQAAQFGKPEQLQLYREFLQQTLPYLMMGEQQFFSFMDQFGWTDHAVLTNLFRTFDVGRKGGLTFRDLLCGMAIIEPGTQHGGPSAELRCKYIFRYFDENSDGQLDFTEFKKMVATIRRMKSLPDDPQTVHDEATKAAAVFGENISDTLNQSDFLTAVGQLKFRGTSHLLRSPYSVTGYLKGKSEAHVSSDVVDGPLIKSRTATPNRDVTVQTIAEKGDYDYDVATHCVSIKTTTTGAGGSTVPPKISPLSDIEHCGLDQDIRRSLSLGGSAVRERSLYNFGLTKYNEMITALKYFAVPINSTPGEHPEKPALNWGMIDRNALADCLITLSTQVAELFKNEPRLVRLTSPVYILGDLHGNVADLLCFEKSLWPLGPTLTPASFLFLGDYVDRGSFSVEVISYLFAHKVSAPQKVFLLRGNHEIREVQLMFTFRSECIAKFGEALGQNVWAAVNFAFDFMPLSATIDNKVFCAHGGIPPPWLGQGLVAAINHIPVPLPKPETQSQLAWELMWSDPIAKEDLKEAQAASLVEGFANNSKRGTGHVFTSQALEAFLQRNNFSHVIRAHEVQEAGFKVQLEGRLLTVFSSSKYCGGSNLSACVLCDQQKLRTIRIDTSV